MDCFDDLVLEEFLKMGQNIGQLVGFQGLDIGL